MALGAFAAGGACAIAGYKYGGQNDWTLPVFWLWAWAVILLIRRIQFSRLLRWPGDPRSATVTSGGRGGRLLVVDVPGDGRLRPLEVHLPRWAPSEMLLPGEGVTLYGREGVVGALLISCPQRGRAFLGTGKRQSAPRAGRETPPEDSGASPAEWAEWARSVRFSTTRLRPGYSQEQVDAFLEAIRDTFLGIREPPLMPDEVQNKQFTTTRLREGYDEEEVDAFLNDVEARLRVKCAECGAETGSAAQVCVVCGAPAMVRPSAAVDPAASALGDSRGRQVMWALVPVVSFTLLAWWPFLVLALIRRRARDWAMLAASLAAIAAEIAIITLASTGVLPTAGVPAAVQALPLSTMILLLAVAAPIYIFVAFRPAAALPSLSDAQQARAAAKRQQPVMDSGGAEGWQ